MAQSTDMKIAFRHFFVISAIASFLPLGCTDWYAHQADKAAYKTVAGGQKAALGTTQPFNASFQPFTADPNSPSVIRVGGKAINIGGDASKTVKLNLADCLEIAFRNSRPFQDRNETLYTQALALANTRRSWDYPLISGSVTGDAEISKENKGPRTQSGEANVGLNLTQRFVDGGVLTAGLALDLATDFAGGNGTTIGSLMNANFTQPLLKGAWHGFAYEDQYRLNRDFLISVFEFNRFAQTSPPTS